MFRAFRTTNTFACCTTCTKCMKNFLLPDHGFGILEFATCSPFFRPIWENFLMPLLLWLFITADILYLIQRRFAIHCVRVKQARLYHAGENQFFLNFPLLLSQSSLPKCHLNKDNILSASR